jgi:hypothetical protein
MIHSYYVSERDPQSCSNLEQGFVDWKVSYTSLNPAQHKPSARVKTEIKNI